MKALFIILAVVGLSTFSFASDSISSDQQVKDLSLSFTGLAQKVFENISQPRPPFAIQNRSQLQQLLLESTFEMSDILETLQSDKSLKPDLGQLLQQMIITQNQFTIISEQVSNSFTVDAVIKNLESVLDLEKQIARTINAPRTECRSLGLLYGYDQICRPQF